MRIVNMTLGKAFQIFMQYYANWSRSTQYQPLALFRIINTTTLTVTATAVENAIHHINTALTNNDLNTLIQRLLTKVDKRYSLIKGTLKTNYITAFKTLVPEVNSLSNQTKFTQAFNLICSSLVDGSLPRPADPTVCQFYDACRIIIAHFQDIDNPRTY